jgi:hypothetical protein
MNEGQLGIAEDVRVEMTDALALTADDVFKIMVQWEKAPASEEQALIREKLGRLLERLKT